MLTLNTVIQGRLIVHLIETVSYTLLAFYSDLLKYYKKKRISENHFAVFIFHVHVLIWVKIEEN